MKNMPAPPKEKKVKKFFSRRLRNIRNLMIYAFAFGGTIGACSVYQEIRYPKPDHTFTNNYFTKNMQLVAGAGQRAAENPVQMISSLYYIIPNYTLYQLDINQTLEDRLEEAVQHEKTLEAVQQLMQKDDQLNYTEVGGLLFLDTDEQGRCLLRFYDVPSKNEKDYLKLLRERPNPEKIIEYFKKDNIHKYLDEREWLNYFIKEWEKEDNPRSKGFLLDNIIYTFKNSSDNLYNLPEKETMHYIYENFLDFNGRFIGFFHTHNDGSPPSRADLSCSQYLRQFVVIRKNLHAYQLRDLYKGEILNKYTISKSIMSLR